MITVNLSHDIDLIKSIATNSSLFIKTHGSKTTLHPSTWTPEPGMQYLVVKHNNKVMGMFPFRLVTNILMEVHIYILPKYSKQRLILKAIKQAIMWSIENYKINKFISWTPDTCHHMITFLAKLDWAPCGHLFNAALYDGKITGILMYQIEAEKYLNVVQSLISNYNQEVA